jgi:hypothetical protein
MFNLAKNGIPIINTPSQKKQSISSTPPRAKNKIVGKTQSNGACFQKVRDCFGCAGVFCGEFAKYWALMIGATAVLGAYQTPMNALINVEDWHKSVNGLGPVITNKVKEVLSTPYKESCKE